VNEVGPACATIAAVLNPVVCDRDAPAIRRCPTQQNASVAGGAYKISRGGWQGNGRQCYGRDALDDLLATFASRIGEYEPDKTWPVIWLQRHIGVRDILDYPTHCRSGSVRLENDLKRRCSSSAAKSCHRGSAKRNLVVEYTDKAGERALIAYG
jgi:hypothetical protein